MTTGIRAFEQVANDGGANETGTSGDKESHTRAPRRPQVRPGRGRSQGNTLRGDTHFRPQGGGVLADARGRGPAIVAEAIDPKGQARRANRQSVGPEDSL